MAAGDVVSCGSWSLYLKTFFFFFKENNIQDVFCAMCSASRSPFTLQGLFFWTEEHIPWLIFFSQITGGAPSLNKRHNRCRRTYTNKAMCIFNILLNIIRWLYLLATKKWHKCLFYPFCLCTWWYIANTTLSSKCHVKRTNQKQKKNNSHSDQVLHLPEDMEKMHLLESAGCRAAC